MFFFNKATPHTHPTPFYVKEEAPGCDHRLWFFFSAGPQGWEPMAKSSCHVLASPGRAWEKKSLDKRHEGKDQDVVWWNCYLEKQIPTSEVTFSLQARYAEGMVVFDVASYFT